MRKRSCTWTGAAPMSFSVMDFNRKRFKEERKNRHQSLKLWWRAEVLLLFEADRENLHFYIHRRNVAHTKRLCCKMDRLSLVCIRIMWDSAPSEGISSHGV